MDEARWPAAGMNAIPIANIPLFANTAMIILAKSGNGEYVWMSPLSWLVSRFTGKTTLCADMIEEFTHIYDVNSVTELSIIYETWQQLYDRMHDSVSNVGACQRGFPTSFDFMSNEVSVEDTTRLLIIDDMQGALENEKNRESLLKVLNVYCHHFGYTVWILLHELNPRLKSLVANVRYITLMRNGVGQSTRQYLQKSVFVYKPGIIEDLYRLFCTNSKHEYVIIDTSDVSDNEEGHSFFALSGLLHRENPPNAYDLTY